MAELVLITKRCSRCGGEKPLDEFHKDKRRSHGVGSWCKACLIGRLRDLGDERRAEFEAGERVAPTRKECLRCHLVKAAEEFNRHITRATGLSDWCRDCKRAAETAHRFGISVEEWAALLEAQGGVCAICRQPEHKTYRGRRKNLAVDHDHETGQIRGLLCGLCNRMLGQARDEPAILEAAAAYLENAKALNATSLLPEGWA